MSQVTKPMMLDETGQAIVTALGNIGSAVQPTNVCVDLPVSIPANGWTNSEPYTYTYTHSKITAECGVTVEFESGASNTDCLAMDYEKVAGGVMFTVKTKPSSAVPVIIHVLNAEAESITSVSADMVSTSAISGSSNVEQALGSLNSKIEDFYPSETFSGDLNNLATGQWYCDGSCSNLPVANAYFFVQCMIRSANIGEQFAYKSNEDRVFFRRKREGTWNNWQELALNSKIDNLAYGDITSQCTVTTANVANVNVYRYGQIVIITGTTKSGVTGTNLTLLKLPFVVKRAHFVIGAYANKVIGEGSISADSDTVKANISTSTDVGSFCIVAYKSSTD